jgi:methyltransferase (TIGR00027 family)
MRDDPSRTAEMVCLFRASDQRRRPEERIVDDPYAKLFLGPLTRAALMTLEATGRLGEIATEHAPGLTTYVLTRHRFIDEQLVRALTNRDRAIGQVVLLGAGYDTRAYRFATEIGARTVFEVDFPSTSRRKAEIVAEKRSELPAVEARRVEIDFLTEKLTDKLDAAGFARGLRTFFIWEGVSMYLTRKAVQEALSTIRGISGPGSLIAMDFWHFLDSGDLTSTAHNLSSSFLYVLGEPMTFSIHPEDVVPFLERNGYAVVDLADAAALEARYVRDDRRVHPSCYVLSAETKA